MIKKYCYGTAENIDYFKNMNAELLKFGENFPSPDGSTYYLGDAGEPMPEMDRATYATCRMAHVYAIGAMQGNEKYLSLSQRAIDALCGKLKDNVNGGWYSGIAADETFAEGKQCYAHAFVMLAASSGILAGVNGAEKLLSDALECYDKFFWNNDWQMAVDTYNTEFTELDSYCGLNANMHSVEAFLAVADATGNEKYRSRAGRIIDRVLGFAENNNYRIPEHFTDKWEVRLDYNADKKDDRFKPYGATPGHGIEWARLITQWALSSDISNREKYIDGAQNLYNRAVSDGWNSDGDRGIVYTTDWNGTPIVHDRMHWTLAEAINTSAVLYRVTGNEKYAADYYEFVKYLDECVHDKINGSWLHQLDRSNKLLTTVWPGKSDLYHAFQATLIPYASPEMSIAAYIKQKI